MGHRAAHILSHLKNKRLFTQLVTVIVGVNTLTVACIYLSVGRQTRLSLIDRNNQVYYNSLQISAQTLDAILSGYHDSLTHITYDSNIIDAVVTPKNSSADSQHAVLSVLNSYKQENEAISQIYLFVSRSDLVLTSGYESQTLENFRDEEIINDHLEQEQETFIVKSGRKSSLEVYGKRLFLVRDFPLNSDKRLGAIFMELNSDVFYKALLDGQTSFSSLYAYDKKLTPLYSDKLTYPKLGQQIQLAFEKKMNTKNASFPMDGMRYFIYRSPESGIRLLLLVDDSYFVPSFTKALQNFFPYLALILLTSLILYAGILYFTYFPVRRLTSIMPVKADKPDMNENSENELEFLTKEFLDLSMQKTHLDQVLDDMTPQISREFYFELLNGKPMDIDYIKKILRNIKSPLETEGLFTTIAIAFKSEFENELHRRFIEELETRLTNLSRDFFHFVIHRTDNTVYTILIQFFPGSSDIKMIHFEIQLEQAFLESLQKFHLAGFLQIEPRCKKIQSLSIVWHETIHHLAEKKYPQKEIEKKDNLNAANLESWDRQISLNYRFFQIQLKSIRDYIEKGENDIALEKALQVCHLLTEAENKEVYLRSTEMYRLAITDTLRANGIKDLPAEGFLASDTDYQNDPEKYMDALCHCAVELLSEKHHKQQHKYLIQAKHYIESHYDDPDLSLLLLAEQCKTTTSYLSRLFKNRFGINFVDYLNQYRIRKAKELLDNTDRTSKEIPLSCGFNSPQNFSRVFKKLEGVTPGQYKSTRGSSL